MGGAGWTCLSPERCIRAKSLSRGLTLCHPVDCSPPGSCPWDSPGKNIGLDCHALLQGIFPTQGSNPHLLPLPTVAGGFFTTSATWEAQSSGLVNGGEPCVILSAVF